MISYYEKFRLLDEGKEKDFFCEVNWNKSDKTSNECKLVKFTFPNGESSIIKKDLLLSMLFAISKSEDQRKMMPVSIQPVHWRTVQLSIKATKDIRKGENIVMNPIKVSIPCDQTKEIIGMDNFNEAVKQQSKKGKIIV